MRILVVEDDRRLAEPVADDLRRQNHAVDVALDGRDGMLFAETGVYDVIVLDLMLPGRSGLDICRELRRRDVPSRVLIVTARDAVADKVTALDGGADDYLVKPFELAELSARIRALARRGPAVNTPALILGDLELDPIGARAFYHGAPLALTRSEFAILELLLRNPRRVFSRSALQSRIADFDANASLESIKTHIFNLRKKLRAAGSRHDAIVTVFGLGYRIAETA